MRKIEVHQKILKKTLITSTNNFKKSNFKAEQKYKIRGRQNVWNFISFAKRSVLYIIRDS